MQTPLRESLRGPEVVLQSLWDGYGSASRVTRQDGSTLVIKRVKPPPGASGPAHERKLRSYEVEAAFYASTLPITLRASGATVALPAPDYPAPTAHMIAIGDLCLTHPVQRPKGGMSLAELRAALRWVAELHAATWEGAARLSDMQSSFWPRGTFFRLATRADELEAARTSAEPTAQPLLAPSLRQCQAVRSTTTQQWAIRAGGRWRSL